MSSLFDELGDMFRQQNELYTNQRELAAIWLEKPVITSLGRMRRIEAGLLIRVEDGKMVDCEEGKPATHKIQMCIGTLYSNFELTLTHIETHEPLNIKL